MLNNLKKYSKKQILTTFGVACGVLLLVLGYWRYSTIYPSTDNAYVGANIIHISPQVSGQISEVYVENHQQVKKGQLLVIIDPRLYQATVSQRQAEVTLAGQYITSSQSHIKAAEADLVQRESEYDLAKKNAARILPLVKKGIVAATEGDDATNKVQVTKAAVAQAENQLNQIKEDLGETGAANAKLQQAQANLADAKLDLEHTHIYAPATGVLINFDLRKGTVVSAQRPFALFDIVEDGHWWVDANFKETELERIRPNQPAKIEVDIYPDIVFEGVVEAISVGSGAAFSLLPPENATGNWVKVTQRIPVRIRFINPDPHYPLRVGASSTVTINTTKLRQ